MRSRLHIRYDQPLLDEPALCMSVCACVRGCVKLRFKVGGCMSKLCVCVRVLCLCVCPSSSYVRAVRLCSVVLLLSCYRNTIRGSTGRNTTHRKNTHAMPADIVFFLRWKMPFASGRIAHSQTSTAISLQKTQCQRP